MPHPQPVPDRRAYTEPVAAPQPGEDLGSVSIPFIGDTDITLDLGGPLRVELDAGAIQLQFGGGLQFRPGALPAAGLRRLYLDLVDGVVETDSDDLGAFFDGLLTVALCSVLRHTIGWRPGSSLMELGLGRLFGPAAKGARQVTLRRRFPAVRATFDPEALFALELRGDALELSMARPVLFHVGGLGVGIVKARYLFATATVELEGEPSGPVRRGLLHLAARTATHWLRRRLPAAMAAPGYDLFADRDRRAHLLELASRLRPDDRHEREPELEPTGGTRAHPLAREAVGGAARLFSGLKAAVVAALATLRLSADDTPPATRVVARIPLGPFSSLALCTDHGSDVVVARSRGEWRFDAPQGLYVYLDQFPELAELRIKQLRARVDRHDAIAYDLRTSPPAGPVVDALLHHLSERHLHPRVPVRWLRERALVPSPGGDDHDVLWRQRFSGGRELVVRAAEGVELRHREDALVLAAPGGLDVRFHGFRQLPPAQLRRIVYRWKDGSLEIDGEPALGPFGQAVLAAITRVRAAPHVPAGLSAYVGEGVEFDEERLAELTLEIFSIPLPLVGPLQLRMCPRDTLSAELGPTELSTRSERGLALTAPELGLALELRGARYDLPRGALEIDASAPPGDYLVALAGLCVEAFIIPPLRRVVPLWPDIEPDRTWCLGHVLPGHIAELLGLGAGLSLPPGAVFTAARVSGALVVGATAPLQVSPIGDSLVGEFAVEALRWRPEGEQIEIVARPPAGQLLHTVARRLHARFTPKLVLHAVGERLGLPRPWPPPPPPPEVAGAPLAAPHLPVFGPMRLHVDTQHPIAIELRRGGARLDFGQGLELRFPDLDLQVDVRDATVTFLPFAVSLTSLPAAGELDERLVSHVVRGLFARVLKWFWPTRRAAAAGRDVLLSFAADRSWGPLEVCTAPEGSLVLSIDADGLALRSPEGITFDGEALQQWLPEFTLYEFAYRFDDGAVRLRVGGLRESAYHELDAVGANTEAVLSDLIRVFVLPHAPEWAQRLGLRILPQPPVPERDPERVTVLQAQLPGGLAKTLVHMDPGDVLVLSADRREIRIESERHLQFDLPWLRMRLELDRARYDVATGEVQIDGFGQLENAFVEALLRRLLVAYEPAAAGQDFSALAAVLDRFPVDGDGRRVLFDSRLARVLLLPTTRLVVRLDEGGLLITADPPLEIDGASVLDYRFGGLRYSFDDAAFHLDVERDGVLAGLFRGKLVDEGEHQLDSVLRPLLPAAMRRPGYRLAHDPDPRATIAALIRMTVGGGSLLAP